MDTLKVGGAKSEHYEKNWAVHHEYVNDCCRTAIYYRQHAFRLCMATRVRVFVQCLCMNKLPKCDSSRRRRDVGASHSVSATRFTSASLASNAFAEATQCNVYDSDALLAVAGLLLPTPTIHGASISQSAPQYTLSMLRSERACWALRAVCHIMALVTRGEMGRRHS